MKRTVEVSCPHCSTPYNMPVDLDRLRRGGLQANCTRCGNRFDIVSRLRAEISRRPAEGGGRVIARTSRRAAAGGEDDVVMLSEADLEELAAVPPPLPRHVDPLSGEVDDLLGGEGPGPADDSDSDGHPPARPPADDPPASDPFEIEVAGERQDADAARPEAPPPSRSAPQAAALADDVYDDMADDDLDAPTGHATLATADDRTAPVATPWTWLDAATPSIAALVSLASADSEDLDWLLSDST